MSLDGSRWSEIANKRDRELLRRIPEIKLWREEENNAGRPSSLEDFFRAHGLCFTCKATGTRLDPVEWEGETSLYKQCPACDGTGKQPLS
jgi:hypothetical protein